MTAPNYISDFAALFDSLQNISKFIGSKQTIKMSASVQLCYEFHRHLIQHDIKYNHEIIDGVGYIVVPYEEFTLMIYHDEPRVKIIFDTTP